jgi:hypothetical protein
MDRKPVWINGRQVYVLPRAKVWDALLAAPAVDFLAVWNGRAELTDEYGQRVSPDDGVRSGQKIVVHHKVRRDGAIAAAES